MIADGLTVFLITAGLFFFVAGTAGLLRFPDTHSRLHALTKADSLGLGLVVLGLLPQMESAMLAVKLVLVWVLVILAAATASQLIARAALPEALAASGGNDGKHGLAEGGPTPGGGQAGAGAGAGGGG